MPRISVFADESGNFDFSRKQGASRYFILTTIACPSFQVGDALLRLRREIAWEGHGTDSEFHATTDTQAVRDRVSPYCSSTSSASTPPSWKRPRPTRTRAPRRTASTSSRGGCT
jgi:hypothetical protein